MEKKITPKKRSDAELMDAIVSIKAKNRKIQKKELGEILNIGKNVVTRLLKQIESDEAAMMTEAYMRKEGMRTLREREKKLEEMRDAALKIAIPKEGEEPVRGAGQFMATAMNAQMKLADLAHKMPTTLSDWGLIPAYGKIPNQVNNELNITENKLILQKFHEGFKEEFGIEQPIRAKA